MAEHKSGFFGSFHITDRDSCRKVIRNGGIAGLISAGITLLFAVGGFFIQTDDQQLRYFLDPWLLIDVVLILVLALFVFKKSRIAATVLFAYFLVSKIMMWVDLGAPKGLFMSVLFLLYYGAAMRGTYLWHARYGVDPADASFAVSRG